MAGELRVPIGEIGRIVATNIRIIRQRNRLTAAELASMLREQGHRRLGRASISQIENYKRRVDVDDLAALARAFRVDPATLLAPIDVPTVSPPNA